MKHFLVPSISMILGLVIASVFTWMAHPEINAVMQALLTVSLLSVLEISLSVDNAVVNASILKKMDDKWKHRFLTWGMAVAVFGMRFLFPLAIVSTVAHVSVFESLSMAISRPADYAEMMLHAHMAVNAFGGAFLLMVFLNYFLSPDKDTHWIDIFEKPASKLAIFQSIELIIAFIAVMAISAKLPESEKLTFLISYIWGIITFLVVHGISGLLGDGSVAKMKFFSSGFGMFLYLEVLDASFSFDGVVGAFALSNQLIIIMIGLGVGAFFVRGITLFLVEKDTLAEFKFLEHGAFYALGVLSLFMLLDFFFNFPDWVTAVSGAAILVLSVLWSIHENRKSTTQQN